MDHKSPNYKTQKHIVDKFVRRFLQPKYYYRSNLSTRREIKKFINFYSTNTTQYYIENLVAKMYFEFINEENCLRQNIKLKAVEKIRFLKDFNKSFPLKKRKDHE